MGMTRKTNLDTDLKQIQFKVGDTFTFEMTDGEKVEAVAVKQVCNDMLFITTDCLKKEYSVYDKHNEKGYGNYEESDLRQHLNNEILARFPHKIKERLITFNNGDYLRLPTEKEIFGVNKYGEEEGEEITQFECMKEFRNRIAFKGYSTDEWEWYWLANKKNNSTSYFCYCDYRGYGSCYSASHSGGVRLVFKLENNNQLISVDNDESSQYKNIYMEYLEKEYEKTVNEFEQTKERVIQKIKDITAFDVIELGAAYASHIDEITKVATKLQTINEMLDAYKYFEN